MNRDGTISWRAGLVAGAVLVFLATFAIRVPHPQWQLLVDLTTAGVVVGGIFALSMLSPGPRR